MIGRAGPVRFAEGIELFEIDVGHADFFLEFARGSHLERFIDFGNPRAAPSGLEGLAAASNEQDFQIVVRNGEDHKINRDGRSRVVLKPAHQMLGVLSSFEIRRSNVSRQPDNRILLDGLLFLIV